MKRIPACRRSTVVALWLAAALATACARAPTHVAWERDYYAAERLLGRGDCQGAHDRLATLSANAPTRRDRHEAAMMQCEALRSCERFAQAVGCWDALAERKTDRVVIARARLHAAQTTYFDLERTAEGIARWQVIVDKAPDLGVGLRALEHLARHAMLHLQTERDRWIDYFDTQYRRRPTSPLADNMLLHAAELQLAEAPPANPLATMIGRPGPEAVRQRSRADEDAAMARFAAIERDHPDSPLLLRARAELARLMRRRGRVNEEAIVLERIMAEFETAHIFGSYFQREHNEAAQRLMTLYTSTRCDLRRAEAIATQILKMNKLGTLRFAYLARRARIIERRGHLLRARQAWQGLLRQVRTEREEMRANDRRICDEYADEDERRRCHAHVKGASDPLPVKEEAHAEHAIERLDDRIAAEGRRAASGGCDAPVP